MKCIVVEDGRIVGQFADDDSAFQFAAERINNCGRTKHVVQVFAELGTVEVERSAKISRHNQGGN